MLETAPCPATDLTTLRSAMSTTNSTVASTVTDPTAKVKLQVRVTRIANEAAGIRSFEMRALDGAELPPFTAGAHLEMHLPSGLIRSYSLCSDPADRSRYVVAVLREDGGRGGSKELHDKVHEGDEMTISAPRNHFPLAGREARFHQLLAGGIGVTPMIAMIAELERRGAPWRLHYCTRDAERTAFRDVLAPHIASGKAVLHHDNGDPAQSLDIKGLLSSFEIGTHLYYCGPPGFMRATAEGLEPWPPHTVHREFFSGGGIETDKSNDTPFEIKLRSTGQVLTVPADKTIVDVLSKNGCNVETDCNEGYCGTCITRFYAGTPEHRDTVLSEKERRTYVMVCCARAKGLLELDL